MKVEYSLQTQCSELVSHLGKYTDDEIIEALKTIHTMLSPFGWDFAVVATEFGGKKSQTKSYIIPVGKHIDELVQVVDLKGEGRNIVALPFNEDAYELIWKNLDYDKVRMFKREIGEHCYTSLPHIVLIKDCPSEPTVVYDWPDDIRFQTSDDYRGIEGLTMVQHQHCEVQKFPAFHRVRELFDSDYEGQDGGSPDDYAAWMAYHEGKDEDDKYGFFKANPPLGTWRGEIPDTLEERIKLEKKLMEDED